MIKKHEIGITLSGGGALGFAHLGALKALEEVGIHPTCLSGSSMGALVGLFYSSGLSVEEIIQIIRTEKVYKLIKIFSLPTSHKNRLGLSTHKSISGIINKYIPYERFEDLPVEFGVSVVNISKERCELISSGEHLKEFVLASMTQPGIFDPIKINGDLYVDGGVLNNFPAEIIRDKCEILIGVNVHPHTPIFKGDSIANIALRTVNTLMVANSTPGMKLCDHLIQSYSNEEYNIFDFPKFPKIYKEGYSQTRKYLKAHPELSRLYNK